MFLIAYRMCSSEYLIIIIIINKSFKMAHLSEANFCANAPHIKKKLKRKRKIKKLQGHKSFTHKTIQLSKFP